MSERNEHIVDYLVRCDGFDVDGVNFGERAPVYDSVERVQCRFHDPTATRSFHGLR